MDDVMISTGSMLTGLGCTITDNFALTVGRSGIIEGFDKNVGKWRVDFGEGWVGWYHRTQFKVDRSK